MDPYELAQKLMSGELVVVVAKNPEPQKPKLTPDEQALADSLTSIAAKYGKFNEDETGIWAGYEAAKDNVVAHIGVKCSNCALYEGNGVCKIIAQKVEDGGKCRFAVIPDGVVKGVWSPETEKPGPRKKKGVKVKALGATIGGTASPDDMIDRDGDGMIFDGTPDEQPVKKKPKPANATANDRRRHQFIADDRGGSLRAPEGQYLQVMDDGSVSTYDGAPDKNYEKLPNTFLERRRRRQVQRDLAAAGETPDQMPNRSDRERALRVESRDNFSVDEDRKRFVRNQLRKRGITPNARLEDRTDEERQARREARAEYDRRMRAGEPRRPSPEISEPPAQGMGPQQFPPGYVPGRPADRYPEPKPDTSFQDNEDRRNAAKRPVGRPVDRLPGAQPGYPNTGSRQDDSSLPPFSIGRAKPDTTNIGRAKPDTTNIGRARPDTDRNSGANAPRRRPGATEPNYRTMPRRRNDAPPTISNMPRRGSDAPPRIEPMSRRPGDPPLRARRPEPGSPPQRTTEPGIYGRPGDPPLRARRPEPGSPPPKTEMVPRREPRNAKERLITRIFED